eukprot:5397754-Amphidinium_carterae.1
MVRVLDAVLVQTWWRERQESLLSMALMSEELEWMAQDESERCACISLHPEGGAASGTRRT